MLYAIINELIMWRLRASGYFDRHGTTQAILYSLFTIIEFSFLAYYLYSTFVGQRYKKALLSAGILFCVVALINLYLVVTSKTIPDELFDRIPIASSAIILMIFCILSLFEELQLPKIGFIYSTSKFWIIIGIMIYFAGTFFFFLQYDELSVNEQNNFWAINLISMTLKNIFFAISFLVPGNDTTAKDVDSLYPFDDFDNQ